jgi:sortase A
VGVSLRRIEIAAWCTGAALLSVFLAGRVHAALGSRAALRSFREAQTAEAITLAARPAAGAALLASGSPNQALWSKERIKEYEESLRHVTGAPLAILRIPRIGLEVPVLDGVDDLTLNRAVGRIPETARPGETGNAGIAGHRDGFFRGLKDVAVGDPIEIETLSSRRTYRVEKISIVAQTDVGVLDATREPTLTLVTCYPFYFVGSAPQRYIVSAVAGNRSAIEPQRKEARSTVD